MIENLGIHERLVRDALHTIRTGPWDVFDLLDLEHTLKQGSQPWSGEYDAGAVYVWLRALSPTHRQALVDKINRCEARQNELHLSGSAR